MTANDRQQPHPSALDTAALLEECDVTPTRRSGPGGQRRNKVQTAITLTHRPTGIRAEASKRRSQAQNQSIALFSLRLKLAVAVRRPCRDAVGASALWQSRCRGGRIAVNPTHDDYPTLLAEALDVLAGCNWDARSASAALGCTTTQLVRFLAGHRPALVAVNGQRADRGMHPLR